MCSLHSFNVGVIGEQMTRGTLAPSRSHRRRKTRLVQHYVFLLTLSPYTPPLSSSRSLRYRLSSPSALSVHTFILRCARWLGYEGRRRSL